MLEHISLARLLVEKKSLNQITDNQFIEKKKLLALCFTMLLVCWLV